MARHLLNQEDQDELEQSLAALNRELLSASLAKQGPHESLSLEENWATYLLRTPRYFSWYI